MATTTTRKRAAARPKAVVADPYAGVTLEVSLERLKNPPKKAEMRRIGIVPDDMATLSEDGSAHFS